MLCGYLGRYFGVNAHTTLTRSAHCGLKMALFRLHGLNRAPRLPCLGMSVLPRICPQSTEGAAARATAKPWVFARCFTPLPETRERFRISDTFIDQYRGVKPPFGYNGLGHPASLSSAVAWGAARRHTPILLPPTYPPSVQQAS